MNEHPIDDLFRKGLGKYQAPAPPSAWQKIAADQARKRRGQLVRRASLWLAAVVLFLGMAYYWVPSSAENSPSAPLPASTLANKDQASTALGESPSPSSSVLLGASEQKNKEEAATGEHEQPSSATQPSQSNNSRSPRLAQAASLTTVDETMGKNQEVASLAASSSSLGAATDQPNEKHEAPLRQALTAVQGIYTLPLPRLAPYQRPIPQPSLQQATGFKKAVRAHWEVELLTGFAYAHQSLDAKTAEDRNDLGVREISEFPGASMLNSLLLSYRQPNGLGFRTGLSYTLLRNRFEYEQQRMLGPDSLQTLFIKSSNRIRLLEVPLLLSYELPGKRFHLSLNAGPVVNIRTAAKGRYLIASQQAPLLLEEEKIYRANVGVSWQAGFTATYDLGGGNSLLIEPSFRSFPQTFTRTTYNLRENYWLAGLQIGLRHKL